MNFLGVAGLLGANHVLGQSIRVAEPWTRQSRLAALGLLLVVGFVVWAAIRVRHRR